MKKFVFLLLVLFFTLDVSAQKPDEIHSRIRNAVETRDYPTAINELQNFERADKTIFAFNNYDYLLARISERNGDFATAMASYQAVVNRNSILSEYALRHLAQIARVSGNLMLERIYLRELLTIAPDGLLNDAASARMARSYFESNDFAATIQMLNTQEGKLRDEASPKSKVQSPKSEIQNPKSDNRIEKQNGYGRRHSID